METLSDVWELEYSPRSWYAPRWRVLANNQVTCARMVSGRMDSAESQHWHSACISIGTSEASLIQQSLLRAHKIQTDSAVGAEDIQ